MSKRSPAGDNTVGSRVDDSRQDGSSELAAIYKRLDATDQRILPAIGGEYISDNEMRQRILNLNRPPLRSRLMDLPTELRLEIAEYVMTAGDSIAINWHILPGSEVKWVRKLGTIYRLAALSRVSRQLYAETSTLVWRLNTFKLFEGNVNHVRWADKHTFLLRHLSAAGLESLRSMEFFVRLSSDIPQCVKFFQKMTEIARRTPAAHLAVYDKTWALQLDDWSVIARYLNRGRELQAFLAEPAYDAGKRNWRLYPVQRTVEYKRMETLVEPADTDLVRSWNRDGL
ncbi:hypothetical protein BKA63DRAFT_162137 [Paraphoma chrysanthemicola]|nr:hypothetical protein BKA63DRAFT_162137 [Paraphoma chrysanthemicola]